MKMKITRLFLIALAIIAVAATATIGLAAVCNTVVVTGDDVVRLAHGTTPPAGTHWALFTRQSGAGDFVVGPGTPPSGVGSLSLQTPGTPPNGLDKVYLFNYDHIGTPLSSIDKISYSTYRDAISTATPVQAPALNIQVDVNGPAPGGFTTLVFEPVYNTSQGVVTPGVWQPWDAFDGGNAVWWSTASIPGVCAFNCFVPWSQIVAANPNAVIVGAFGVNQGGGNDGLFAFADVLSLGYNGACITYDFEPFRTPASATDCKNGGWQTLKRADGSSFKNQGQCVSYVQTGK